LFEPGGGLGPIERKLGHTVFIKEKLLTPGSTKSLKNLPLKFLYEVV